MFSQQDESSSSSLNDYILQDKIQSDSFGKVYRVKSKINKVIYAAKISIDFLDRELFMNISREVNIISKLNRPSVLKFILFSQTNFRNKPNPVIITEYARNNSLLELNKHDRDNPNNRILDDTRKIIITYWISSAMPYLHSHDILHRDLKPSNILHDQYLNPKVSDFVLSNSSWMSYESITTDSTLGTVKGTPAYISPEMWSKSSYSKSSDVYSFGNLLNELMTGENPFPSFDIFNLRFHVLQGVRPESNASTLAAYKSLIERC